MREIFEELIHDLERGEPVAMATIVKRKGSVPREVGAKMLVHRGGRISGTVGGGCGEAEVWRSALNVIDTLRPNTVQVDLTEEIAMESQGVCGGTFDVFIQPWHNSDSVLPDQSGEQQTPAHEQLTMRDSALAIVKALAGEQAIALVTLIAAGGSWRPCIGQHLLVYEQGKTMGTFTLSGDSSCTAAMSSTIQQAARRAIDDGKPYIEKIIGPEDAWAELFIEPFTPRPVLLIAGAGHIAAPLAAIASLMNYSVAVTDDRASFANRDRFPSAQQVLVGDIELTLKKYVITPRTYIVLVTRAHAHDVQGLRAIIDSPAAYIGMIGSQRRIWAVFKLLHDEGISAEKLARVHAPIGIDLGGSTPDEIALSIMAEITLLRRGGSGIVLSEPLRARYMQRLKRLDQDIY